MALQTFSNPKTRVKPNESFCNAITHRQKLRSWDPNLDPCSIIYVREGNPLNNEWLCVFISPITNTFIHLPPQPTPISTADYTFSLQWLYSPTCPESDSLALINWSTLVILRVHSQNPNYVLLSSVRDRTLRLDPCSIIYVREGNPLNNEWLCVFSFCFFTSFCFCGSFILWLSIILSFRHLP